MICFRKGSLSPPWIEAVVCYEACIFPRVSTEPQKSSFAYVTLWGSGNGNLMLCDAYCSKSPFVSGIEGVDMNFDVEVLALGDATTSQPNDYWMHPCQCFPIAWGVKPPVTQESFNDIPPGSLNSFLPSRFRISSGGLTCPSSALITQSQSFPTLQGEVGETECESLCELEPSCAFYFIGTASQAQQCRLYTSCQFLTHEQMLEGSLFGIYRSILNTTENATRYCRIADPYKCWSVTMRRAVMGAHSQLPLQNLPAPTTFAFHTLAAQCDLYLLLGGAVTSCGKPSYTLVDSHIWSGKTALPAKFPNGAGLSATCWSERYTPVPASSQGLEAENLLCAQGTFIWTGSSAADATAPLVCGSCIQLSQPPFWTLQGMDRQELYFSQKLTLLAEAPASILLGNYTVRASTCDQQRFEKNSSCLELQNASVGLETCEVGN